MRTTLVGSWLVEERFRLPLARYHCGRITEAEVEPLLREVATVAIAQQRCCGVDELTGGETATDSFVLHFSRYLSGIELTDATLAWGGRGACRIVGPVDAPAGLGLATAFRRERSIAPDLTEVTIPGPSEFTTMLEPPDTREAAWPGVVGLIRREIGPLIEVGARDVQLDLPQVAMGLADGGWTTTQAVDTIAAVFDGVRGVRRSVHFCYGDFGARSWVRNRALGPPTDHRGSGRSGRSRGAGAVATCHQRQSGYQVVRTSGLHPQRGDRYALSYASRSA